MNNLKPYKNYKPSNIAWLGDIPEHWEVSRLKYLADCFPSNVDKHSREGENQVRLCNYTDVYKNDFISEKLKFMVATASNEQIQKFTLLKDDVIITKDSETSNDIAVPAMVTESLTNVICGYHLSVIRANNDVYAKYLFRLFQHKKFNSQFEICSNGVTRVGLGVYDLVNAFGIKPSYSEQQAIANFLDYKLSKIDRFIQKKKQLIKLLNEQKAGIINDAVTKGLNLNAKMKPSNIEWLGDIPEHWEVRKLKYLVSKIGDVDHYMPPTIENGIPYVMTGNLEDFVSNIDFQSCKKVSQLDYDNLSKKIKSAKGDVILARYATIGTVAYIDIDLEFLVSYSCVTIKPNPSKLLGLYLFYYFKTNVFTLEIRNQVNVNTQGNVGIRDLKEVRIILPPYHEQINLVEFIEKETAKLNQAIATIEKEIVLTQEYRVALIAEAVTGKIDVRDYEIPETPIVELYEELEEEMSLAAEEEVGYLTEEIL